MWRNFVALSQILLVFDPEYEMDSFDVIQCNPNPLGAGPNPVQSLSQAQNPNQSSYSTPVHKIYGMELASNQFQSKSGWFGLDQ